MPSKSDQSTFSKPKDSNLLWGIPWQPEDNNPSSRSRVFPGAFPCGISPEQLPWEPVRLYPCMNLEVLQLAQFLGFFRYSNSSPCHGQWVQWPCGETSFWPSVLAILTFQSLPTSDEYREDRDADCLLDCEPYLMTLAWPPWTSSVPSKL